MVFEDDGTSTSMTERHLHGSGTDRLISVDKLAEQSWGVRWALSDHQGSTRAVLVFYPGSGSLVGKRLAYDAFGNVTSVRRTGVARVPTRQRVNR